MKRALKISLVLITILLSLPIVFFFWYFFFGGDYEISLPNDYTLVRIYGSAIYLVDSNNQEAIPPSIDGYKVFKNIIIGHVTNENLYLVPEDAVESIPGYFIVDMKTGNMQQGLDEQQWLNSLLKYGIIKRPSLHKPSRYDEFLGYNKPSGP